MCNLIEFINNFFSTSRISFQCCSYIRAIRINNKDNLEFTDFNEANATSDSFDLKVKLTGKTGNNGTKIAAIMVLLKYLSDSLRTFEMSLIKCEITRDLNWYENCVLVAANIEQIKLNHFQYLMQNFIFQLLPYQLKITHNCLNNQKLKILK